MNVKERERNIDMEMRCVSEGSQRCKTEQSLT